MDLVIFWTIFILGPIPIIHILLHVFLGVWRRCPRKFYQTALGFWISFFFFAKWQAGNLDVLFTPPMWLKILCTIAIVSLFFLIIWSIMTLKPQRFFLWATLQFESVQQKKISLGPYKYFHHPAYTAYVVIAFAAFFGTGRTVLLAFASFMILLMLIVILRENHELSERFGR